MALLEVTGETFAEEVLQSEKPVLVDFWGPRCQPCLALMPVVEELAAAHEAQLKVVKVNANTRPNWRLCGDHKVLGLPAYLFFNQGEEQMRLSGNDITRATLSQAIEEVIGNGSA